MKTRTLKRNLTNDGWVVFVDDGPHFVGVVRLNGQQLFRYWQWLTHQGDIDNILHDVPEEKRRLLMGDLL